MKNILFLISFILISFIGFSQNDPVASNVSAAALKNTNATIHLVASDLDFDSLTYSIVSDPSNGTVTLSGDTVTYVPNTDFSGIDTFTYKANDGSADSTTKTVTVKVVLGYRTNPIQIGTDIDGESEEDESGFSVSFNEDHTIMAIGAPYNNGIGSWAGHVRVYKYNGTTWSQLGDDIDAEEMSDESGHSVSLSSDGMTVAIGAPNANAEGYSNSGRRGKHGSVMIYSWDGTTWIQKGNKFNNDIEGKNSSDNSGYSVSLSSDGMTVAIGALFNLWPGTGSGTVEKAGYVSVYNWNGTTWIQLGDDIFGCAPSSDCINGIGFKGISVSLSSDGTTVAIGDDFYKHEISGSRTGRVRIYTWNGTTWSQQGNDMVGEAIGDQSGYSVSLSSNGATVAIGARYNDAENEPGSGHVRIYNYNGTTWSQLGSDIDGEKFSDRSGHSVSLSSDGMTVAIGAPNNSGNGNYSGHVRVYKYNGTNWSQIATDIDGKAADDYSGSSVSLSSDGTTVAIGAPRSWDNGMSPGYVRVYSLVNLNGSPVAVDDVAFVNEDDDLTSINVIDNDTDEEGDTLSLVSVSTDGTGTVAINADGLSVDYTPSTNFNGEEIITYTVSDGSITDNTGTLRIIVFSVNDAPLASNVSAAALKNTNATIHLVASDLDFHSLTYSIVSNPSKGTVTLSGDTVTYLPTTDFSGTDTFTFNANDGYVDSTTKTVTVKVIDEYKTTPTQIGIDIDGEASDDYSGYSVSSNEDHTIMAIGAPYNNGTGTSAGHVRVYKYNGTTWSQLGDDIDGEASGDYSGNSVSLSSDGSTVSIGALGNGDASGHVRIYTWNGTTWSQLGDDIDGEASGDYSGTSVSLSSDGTTVAIGATDNGNASGHVRIYTWNGTTWSQLGDDIDGEEIGDESGHSVSLSSDGSIVAIGARYNDGVNGDASGHVRIYTWNGTTWSQLGDDIDGESSGDYSGHSVLLSSDGTTVSIGALGNSGTGVDSGHVRIYSLVNLNENQLSVDDELLDNYLELYPNPVTNILSIESKITSISKVEIYTVLGKKIKEITSNFGSITTDKLPKGIYIIRIYSEESSMIRKIIKI